MVLILLQLLPQLLRAWRTRWLPLGPLGLMTFLRKSGSLTLVAVWTKLLATIAWCSLCSGSRSCGTNFVVMCFMPRSSIKISVTVVLGIPRSASSSHTVSHRSLLITAYTSSTFSGVLLVAGLAECRSLSTDSQPSLKHLCHTFICVAVIASSLKTFWIIWILFVEECSSLMQNAHSFLYSFSHFESGGHTVHMLTWQCLPPHWPVQWSHHCSHMCIPVHSVWLPGYIAVRQTVFIILTMAGLFPDRLLTYVYVYVNIYAFRSVFQPSNTFVICTNFWSLCKLVS